MSILVEDQRKKTPLRFNRSGVHADIMILMIPLSFHGMVYLPV
ncbi:hypothetical protein HMPREF9412_5343 [Paenibacillus sp. HGF5]|nr:hypothetical protein HMPREF9412_5343 [Paenibacillus sp. HGF5]